MAAGLAGGIGRGAASYGLDLMKQADQKELLDERQADRLELQRERMAATAGAKVSQSPAQKLYEFGQMLLNGGGRGALMAGGMAPGAAQDATDFMQGRTPMQSVDMPVDRFTNPDRQDAAAGQDRTAQAPKYTDGQAAQLMERSRIALRRAMGLVDPGASDDIAKAEGTEQTNDLVRRYVAGDTAAGRGALASLGKTTFGPSGDELTGAVPKGSVAESTVRKNMADAGESSAHASLYGAQEKKVLAEISGELAKETSREKLTEMLGKLNTYAKDANLSDAELAEVNALRQRISRQMDRLVGERESRGRGGKPSPDKADPGGKSLPEAPRDPAARKVGQTYSTPKGPLTWTGQGWKR